MNGSARIVGGRLNCCGYSAPRKYKPHAFAGGGAVVRSFAFNNASVHCGGCSPRPMLNNAPVMFNTIRRRKPSAQNVIVVNGGVSVKVISVRFRSGVFAEQPAARKDVKSFLPINSFAASRMLAMLSAASRKKTLPDKNGASESSSQMT